MPAQNHSEYAQLSLQLRPGHQPVEPPKTGHGAQLLTAHLSYHLSLLIAHIYQVTDAYPVAGDELLLESALVAPWEKAAGGVELTQWYITRRAFLLPLARLTIVFDITLLRQEATPEPKELIDLEALVDLMPSAQSRRALRAWVSKPGRPVRTWRELAQWGHELASERGFNPANLELVRDVLRTKGLHLNK